MPGSDRGAAAPETHRPEGQRPEIHRPEGQRLIRHLTGRGLLAGLNKVAAALLSLAMFAALARALDPDAFGRFNVALSAATVLALVGEVGGRRLMLRHLPSYLAEDPARARGLVRTGLGALAAVSALCMAGLAAAALLADPDMRLPLLAALPLIPGLALAELLSGLLRAHGAILRALAPRDVLWRAGVALGASLAGSAAAALALTGAVLWTMLALQLLSHPGARIWARGPASYDRSWRRTAAGLWGTGIVQMGAPHLQLVLLGTVLAPAVMGGVASAFRVAPLVGFFMMAANIVAAPMISRAWDRGDLAGLRRLFLVVNLGAAVPSALVFTVLLAAGDRVLAGMFGVPDYAQQWPVLVLLGAGQMTGVLCGQVVLLLIMTGHERVFLAIMGGVTGTATLVAWVAAWALGPAWAAAAIMAGMALWNVSCVVWARRRLGIDPSVPGVLARRAGPVTAGGSSKR